MVMSHYPAIWGGMGANILFSANGDFEGIPKTKSAFLGLVIIMTPG